MRMHTKSPTRATRAHKHTPSLSTSVSVSLPLPPSPSLFSPAPALNLVLKEESARRNIIHHLTVSLNPKP